MFDEDRFKIGLFVITGTTLFFISLFVLGLRESFVEHIRMYSLFDESIQGLEVGSPVKYKGVTIGSVSEIKIMKESQLVDICFEINPTTIDYDSSKDKNHKFIDELTHNLNCQLQLSGITGMKFVQFDNFTDENPNYISEISRSDRIYIPSRRSNLDSTLVTVQEALAKISKIDFDGLSDALHTTVTRINRILDAPKIKKSLDGIGEIVKNTQSITDKLNQKVDKVDVVTIEKELIASLKKIQSASQTIEQKLGGINTKGLSDDAQKLLQTGAKTVQKIDKKVSIFETDLALTLKKLNNNLDSINNLVEFLENNPDALLKGKDIDGVFSKE